MWALIDVKTADGQMWDWDPNLCCTEHALAPLGLSLAEWITHWLRDTMPDGPCPQRELSGMNCAAR
jgi:hypothetical protein